MQDTSVEDNGCCTLSEEVQNSGAKVFSSLGRTSVVVLCLGSALLTAARGINKVTTKCGNEKSNTRDNSSMCAGILIITTIDFQSNRLS